MVYKYSYNWVISTMNLPVSCSLRYQTIEPLERWGYWGGGGESWCVCVAKHLARRRSHVVDAVQGAPHQTILFSAFCWGPGGRGAEGALCRI